jgi:dCTP diphosphatase
VEQEMADVLLYLVRLADRLGVDLEQAALAKIELNAQKYPVEKARGSSRKYDEL